ncbi:prepilin peptidase [Prosthecobacter sp.]|uniref:prepilin peptidase n=1 Tax=Prosthecobacter sp. TaxID=1965333 RepID=UPI003783321F
MRFQILNTLLHLLAFYMGAGIGSFLNVVIYRLPLEGKSVNNPKRSFCPSCGYQIPMWQNIPLLSWLLLRGRCANCKSRISIRYFLVELLTGVMFYMVFLKISGDYAVGGDPWPKIKEWGPQVLCLWIFISLLISGTFIDIDHFILPHSITIGGAAVGLLASFWVPGLVGETTHLRGLYISLASAALGLGLLWIIVELGKLAFGKVHHRQKPGYLKSASPSVCWLVGKFMGCEWLDNSVKWSVDQVKDDEPPVVSFAKKKMDWGDIYGRESDRMVITCDELQVNDRSWKSVTAEMWHDKLRVKSNDSSEDFPLEGVTTLHGIVSEVVIPREAMGFGDVLFLMMIGSFCGWQSVLFTIFAASMIGTLFAMVPRLLGKAEWSAKIPFGPYLALGATIWVFCGPQLVEWYVSKTMWRQTQHNHVLDISSAEVSG